MSILKAFARLFKRILNGKKTSPHRKKHNGVSKRKKSRSKKRFRSSQNIPRRRPIKTTPVKKKSLKFNSSKNAKNESEIFVGEITHFFPRIQVCVLKVNKSEIKIGDKILIRTKNGSFEQQVKSLQIESVDVRIAKKGQLVGLKLNEPAQAGDKVFRM